MNILCYKNGLIMNLQIELFSHFLLVFWGVLANCFLSDVNDTWKSSACHYYDKRLGYWIKLLRYESSQMILNKYIIPFAICT